MININIHNLRYGFANNSSSSHSLIYAGHDGRCKNLVDHIEELGHYGWEEFILKSGDAKCQYLATLLKSNLNQGKGYESFADLPKWMVKCILERYEPHSRIDIDSAFIEHGSFMELPLIDISNVFRCRYDKKYKYWSLFNNGTGTKIRFSFDDYTAESTKCEAEKRYGFWEPIKKVTNSSTPELIDLKITNYCNKRCDFCYQNSSNKGEHADKYEIYNTLIALEELKVWEVAIGGGEPTSHPDFVEILESFRFRNIVVNFTTGTLDWMEDDKIVNAVKTYVSSFAYSIKYSFDVKYLYRNIVKYGFEDCMRGRIYAQVVLGTVSEKEFDEILMTCNCIGIPLTVLGYKKIGRGEKFNNLEYSWAWKKIKQSRDQRFCPSISVDEQFIADFKLELDEDDNYVSKV